MTLTASAQVTEETTWNFSSKTSGDAITSVSEDNGLWYRATDAHAINIGAAANVTFTFADETTYQAKSSANLLASLPSNPDLAPAADMAANAAADDTNDRSLAFTTGKPGTIYVAYRGASSTTEGRSYKLFMNGTEVASTPIADIAGAANRAGTFMYTATSAGTFVIGGGANMQVYMVKFVPAPEATTWTFNSLEPNSLTTEQKYQDLGGSLMFTGSATGAEDYTFNLKELAEPLNGTFSDGTAWSASKYINLPANTGGWTGAFSSRRNAGADGEASNSTFRRAIAYNAAKKGTFYVIFGAASEVADKLFEIYASYNDGSSNTYSTESTAYATGPVEVKLTTTVDNATFWARGTQNGTRIYAVRFVPEGATTGIDTVSAAAPAKADGAWYTISGQRVSQPTKGLYIHNGKKVVMK